MECERSEFEIEQYKTLREEIGARQARAARVMYSGLFGIPSIVAVGKFLENEFDVGESLFLMAPLVILVSCFVFVSEYLGMMRAGVYIRNYIEPHFLPKGAGWENWLFGNEHVKSRRVDNFTVLSFLWLRFCISLARCWRSRNLQIPCSAISS